MPDVNEPIEYQTPAAGAVPAILTFGALIGLLMLVLTATSGGPWWFILGVLAILGWNAYLYLVRSARAVSIVGGTLYWTGYVRSDRVSLDQIARLSLSLGGTFQVVECRDGRKLWITIAQGYRPFGKALADAVPDVPSDLGGYSRFVEHFQLRRRPPDDRA
jgi:hypothetical protein